MQENKGDPAGVGGNLVGNVGVVAMQRLAVRSQGVAGVVSAGLRLDCAANEEAALFANGKEAVASLCMVGRRLSAGGAQRCQNCEENGLDLFHASLLFTGDPLNTSLMCIMSRAASMCFISPGVSWMSSAPMFSFSLLNLRVPGMGTIHGFLHIIQAREICAGVACFCAASSSRRANRALFCSKLSFWNCGMEAR